MIKAILFDLDGTLIDFFGMKKKCCEAAINSMIKAGLRINKAEALSILFDLFRKYGAEYHHIFQRFLAVVKRKIDYRIVAHGMVAYRKARAVYLKPYAGVIPVLKKLKPKFKLGIVSDALRIKAWYRLVAMGIADFFDVIVCFEDTKQLKPGKLPFTKALGMLKAKPSEVLMIGDSIKRDIAGAKKLGMLTCFAKYGALNIVEHITKRKSHADFEINDIRELLSVIKRLKWKSKKWRKKKR